MLDTCRASPISLPCCHVDRQVGSPHHGAVSRIATPAASFPPLPRAPLVSTAIAEQILARIVCGAVPVGSRLPSETDLARDFGVSRPSVREALAALQFAGHVESRRGFGTVVISSGPSDRAAVADPRPMPLASLRDAVDVLETRVVLEPAALALAATDPDVEALADARGLIEGMQVAVESPGLHSSTDLLVHRALLRVCRNTVMRDAAFALVERSLDPMLRTARTQAWASPDLPRAWADEHDLVWQAIRARNPEEARAGALRHLASVVHNLAAATRGESALEQRMHTMMTQLGLDPTTRTR